MLVTMMNLSFSLVCAISTGTSIYDLWPGASKHSDMWVGKGGHDLFKWHLSLAHLFIKYVLFISWQLDIFCMDYNAQIIYDKWKPIFYLKQCSYNTGSHCISLCLAVFIFFQINLKKCPTGWLLSVILTNGPRPMALNGVLL